MEITKTQRKQSNSMKFYEIKNPKKNFATQKQKKNT